MGDKNNQSRDRGSFKRQPVRRKNTQRGGERQLEYDILDALNKMPNVFAFKYDPRVQTNSQGQRLKLPKYVLAGVSDIIALMDFDGCMFTAFLEVKLPGEKQRDTQIAFETRVSKMNGYYQIVESVEEGLCAINKAKVYFDKRRNYE